MFQFTSLVPSKLQSTANKQKKLDWEPGNKYTCSLEVLTRENIEDADKSGCDWLGTKVD